MPDYRAIKKSLGRAKQSIENYHSGQRRPQCDKLGFNIVPKCNSFVSMQIDATLVSHRGFYGDSSCSTVLTFDEVFKSAFIRVLDAHKWELVQSTLDLLQADALALQAIERTRLLDALKDLDVEEEEECNA